MKELTLTSPNQQNLVAKDLAQFLYYFRVAYAGAMELRNDSPETLYSDRNHFLVAFPPILQAQVSKRTADKLFHEDLRERELLVTRVQWKGTLEIGFVGWGTALVGAALLTGGEVSLEAEGIRVAVPELTAATSKLMAACGLRPALKPRPGRIPSRTAHAVQPMFAHDVAVLSR